MLKGKLKYYIHDESHGLIQPADSSRDVYFNEGVVVGGTNWLLPGVALEYELFEPDSSPQAKLVRKP